MGCRDLNVTPRFYQTFAPFFLQKAQTSEGQQASVWIHLNDQMELAEHQTPSSALSGGGEERSADG